MGEKKAKFFHATNHFTKIVCNLLSDMVRQHKQEPDNAELCVVKTGTELNVERAKGAAGDVKLEVMDSDDVELEVKDSGDVDLDITEAGDQVLDVAIPKEVTVDVVQLGYQEPEKTFETVDVDILVRDGGKGISIFELDTVVSEKTEPDVVKLYIMERDKLEIEITELYLAKSEEVKVDVVELDITVADKVEGIAELDEADLDVVDQSVSITFRSPS